MVGVTISGRVTSEDGQPIAHVFVYGSDDVGGYELWTSTDNEGSYQLLARPGDYRIHFAPGWDSPNSASTTTTPPVWTTPTCHARCPGGRWHRRPAGRQGDDLGRVGGPDGTPIAGVYVYGSDERR